MNESSGQHFSLLLHLHFSCSMTTRIQCKSSFYVSFIWYSDTLHFYQCLFNWIIVNLNFGSLLALLQVWAIKKCSVQKKGSLCQLIMILTEAGNWVRMFLPDLGKARAGCTSETDQLGEFSIWKLHLGTSLFGELDSNYCSFCNPISPPKWSKWPIFILNIKMN